MHRYILQELKTLVGVVVDNAVGQVDQQLGEAALRSSIVAEDGGESGVTKRLWETLAKSLACSSVVAEAIYESAFAAHIKRQ